MNFDRRILEVAHKHSIFNKQEILQSEICGCFYCLKIFKPAEIVEWVDEDAPKGLTAMCPYCGMDSVIGDKTGYPVNDENFLKAMGELYF